MGKHMTAIQIILGPDRSENRYRQARVNYRIEQCGKVLKRGSGIGSDGAWAAANKAVKRLEAKGVK
jgi:hypothetical protein